MPTRLPRQPFGWVKMRVNRGQEFVIGDYTIGTKTFDALIFGYDEGERLIYAARARNGFTPAARAQLFRKCARSRWPNAPLPICPRQKAVVGDRA